MYLHYETNKSSEAKFKAIMLELDREERGANLTSILLMRIGEEKQSVLHLIPQGLHNHLL